MSATAPPRLLRLVQRQVHVGRPLPFSVRDETGKLLLARGQVVSSPDQLEELLQRGAYVDAAEMRQAATPADDGQRKLTLFDLWEQAIWRLERLLKTLAEPQFAQRADEFARALVSLVTRDPDIGIYLAMRQDEKRLAIYGLTHSLYTALTCTLIAQRMDWAEDRQLSLVKAALTMNQPILELQGRLATQGNRPTEQQRASLLAHPQACADALAAAGVTDTAWLEAVAQHHEQPGGKGYPRALAEPAELAVALRQADVFMAKISPRASRPPLPIQEAERQLFAEAGGSALAAAVIKEFGLFPPGDFVLLKSGEMAVVVRRGETLRTPIAATVTDRAGMPVLKTVRRDTAKEEFAILGPAPDKRLVLRLPPERLFGLPE